MFYEAIVKFASKNLLFLFFIPFYLAKGRAFCKKKVTDAVIWDVNDLPYNNELLAWLRSERKKGNRLILCSAADSKIVNLIARHIGIFHESIGSNGSLNLKGEEKAKYLHKRFKGNFDYVGNDCSDKYIWRISNQAILVNSSPQLLNYSYANYNVKKVFIKKVDMPIKYFFDSIRVKQWLKNLLIFSTLLASQDLSDLNKWIDLTYGFVSFSLLASAVYLINDLVDLDNDRKHPLKKMRPLASGNLKINTALISIPLLILASLMFAYYLPVGFFVCLCIYFSLNLFYSLILKKVILIDCFLLAILYALRIVSGVIIANNDYSFWFISFSLFFFISLAFLKRFLEIDLRSKKSSHLHGRGYILSDAHILAHFGISSGYLSVLIFALYLNSNDVLKVYKNILFLFPSVVILLTWISYVWFLAMRHEIMNDDPFTFCLEDRRSLLLALAFASSLVLASI